MKIKKNKPGNKTQNHGLWKPMLASFKNVFRPSSVLKSGLVHLLFISLYPVVTLYSFNIGKIEEKIFFLTLTLVILFSMMALLFFYLVFRKMESASLVTSVWILLFFSFGHVYNFFSMGYEDVTLPSYTLIFGLWTMLYVLSFVGVVIFRHKLSKITSGLNLFSFVILILPLINIISFHVFSGDKNLPGTVGAFETTDPKNGEISEKPDVYYIILDRYASSENLLKFYNFDNSGFLKDLRDLGFVVPAGSRANYLKTAHSLASSLNMEYLDDLEKTYGKKERSWKPLYTMLRDFRALKLFKEAGYKFIFFGTWWEPTSRNEFADRNVNMWMMPEFTRELYKHSYFATLGERVGFFNERVLQWNREKYKLDELSKLSEDADPTFAFAHFLLPHGPYVFSENGSYIPTYEGKTPEDLYLGQVKFANSEIVKLVKNIQKKSPNSVIIIQSDEGPHPKEYEIDQLGFDWTNASNDQLGIKMMILNAYYFPKKETRKLIYDGITPVNTFRIFFDTYFGTKMGTLPDKSFIYGDFRYPYDLINVDDKLISHDQK